MGTVKDMDDIDKEYGVDNDYEFPDFDGGDKPLTIGNVLRELPEHLTDISGETVRRAALNQLPSDIRGEFDKITEVLSEAGSEITNQIEKFHKDASNTAKALKQIIPKGGLLSEIFDKTLGNFIIESERNMMDHVDKKAEQQNAITNEINAAIGVQAKAQEIQNNVNNILNEKRTRSTNDLLKHVVANTTAMKEIALTATINYQRKHLELQFKQTYVLQDMLAFMKESGMRNDGFLQAIVKNTSLPDMAKIKFSNKIKNQLTTYGRNFVTKKFFEDNDVVQSMKKNIKNKVSGFFNDMQDRLSMVDMGVDMASMMQDAMEGMDKNMLVASELSDHVHGFAAKPIFKLLYDNKFARKIFRIGKELSTNPAEYLRAIRGGIEGDGFLSNAARSLLNAGIDITNTSFSKNYGDVQRESLTDPAVFDGRTKTTIHNVIPGYLRLIHAEIKAHRMGSREDSTEQYQMSYDFGKDDFVSTGSITTDLLETAKEKLMSQTEGVRNSVSNLFKGMVADGDTDFTDDELNLIGRSALKAALETNLTGRQLFTSENFQQALYAGGVDRNFIEKILRANEIRDAKYDSGEDTYLKESELGLTYDLRRATPSISSEITEMVRDGNISKLAQIGLATYDKNSRDYTLNRDAIDRLMYGALGELKLDNSKSADNYYQQRTHIMAIDDAVTRRKELEKLNEEYKDLNESGELNRGGLSRSDFTYENIKQAAKEIKDITKSTYKDILSEAKKNETFAKLYDKFKKYKGMSKEEWIAEARKANDYIRNFDREELERLYEEFKVKSKEYAKKTKDKVVDKIYEKYGEEIEEFKESELAKDLLKAKQKIEESAMYNKAKDILITSKLKIKSLPATIRESSQYKTLKEHIDKHYGNLKDFTKDKINELHNSEVYKKFEEYVDAFQQTEVGKKVTDVYKKGEYIARNFQSVSTDAVDKGLDFIEANTAEDFKNKVKNLVRETYQAGKNKLLGIEDINETVGSEGESITDLTNEADIESLITTHSENLLKAAESGLEESFNAINSNVPDVVRSSPIYQEAYQKGLGILERSSSIAKVAEKQLEAAMKGPDDENKKQNVWQSILTFANRQFSRIPGSGAIKLFAKGLFWMFRFGNSVERKLISTMFKPITRLFKKKKGGLTEEQKEDIIEELPKELQEEVLKEEQQPAKKKNMLMEFKDKIKNKLKARKEAKQLEKNTIPELQTDINTGETKIVRKEKANTLFGRVAESRYKKRVREREEAIINENSKEGFLKRVKKKIVNGREVKDGASDDKEKKSNWGWLKWLGMGLLGILGKVSGFAKKIFGKVTDLFGLVGGFAKSLLSKGAEWFGSLAKTFTGAISNLASSIWAKGSEWIAKLGSVITKGFSTALAGAKHLFSNAATKVSQFADNVADKAKNAYNKSKNFVEKGIDSVVKGAKNLGNKIVNFGKKLIPDAVLKQACEKILLPLKNMAKSLGGMITNTLKKSAKLGKKLSKKVLGKIAIKTSIKIGSYLSLGAGNLLAGGLMLWDLGWIGYYYFWADRSLIGSIIYQLTGFDVNGEFEEDELSEEDKQEEKAKQDEVINAEDVQDFDIDNGSIIIDENTGKIAVIEENQIQQVSPKEIAKSIELENVIEENKYNSFNIEEPRQENRQLAFKPDVSENLSKLANADQMDELNKLNKDMLRTNSNNNDELRQINETLLKVLKALENNTVNAVKNSPVVEAVKDTSKLLNGRQSASNAPGLSPSFPLS